MDVMPLLAEGGSFAGSTHLVVERQPRYQRTTAQVELLFLCPQHSRLSKKSNILRARRLLGKVLSMRLRY